MTPEVARRFAKAERFLRQCFRDDPIEDTESLVTNAYYAMYHAAAAYLMARGERPPKSHSQMVGAFGRNVRSGSDGDREAGRHLRVAHDLRLLADYDDAVAVPPDRAADIQQKAVSFVDRCRALVSELP